jgi:hypothetical protein
LVISLLFNQSAMICEPGSASASAAAPSSVTSHPTNQSSVICKPDNA